MSKSIKSIFIIFSVLWASAEGNEPEKDALTASLTSIFSVLLSEPADPCEEYENIPPPNYGEPPIAVDPPEECGGKPIFIKS